MDRADDVLSDDNSERNLSDSPAADVIRAALRLEARQNFPRELADRILGILATDWSNSSQPENALAHADPDQLQLILDGQKSLRTEVGDLLKEIQSLKDAAQATPQPESAETDEARTAGVLHKHTAEEVFRRKRSRTIRRR